MGAVIPFRPRRATEPIDVVVYQPDVDAIEDVGWTMSSNSNVSFTAIASTEDDLFSDVERYHPGLVLVIQDFAAMRRVSMGLPAGQAMAYAMRDADGAPSTTWLPSGGLRAVIGYPLRREEIELVVEVLQGRRGVTWATR